MIAAMFFRPAGRKYPGARPPFGRKKRCTPDWLAKLNTFSQLASIRSRRGHKSVSSVDLPILGIVLIASTAVFC
jgi:hypothetical protein